MSYPDICNLNLKIKSEFPDVDELCTSVCVVLDTKGLHRKVIHQVLDGALWWMADYSGKGLKCPFRSKKAHSICSSLDNGDIRSRGLIHEHIIPKNLIRAELMNLTNPATRNEVRRLLKLSVYCLVHKECDDKKLNENGGRQNMPNSNWAKPNATTDAVWARYSVRNIEVIDTRFI